MKRVAIVAVTCVLMAAMLSACGGETAPVELTQADSGTAVSVGQGQQLTITLEANPTTGYSWAIDGELPAQLAQAGEPAYTAESDLVGAGGTEVWTFTGADAGKGMLKLKYWRSFEPTATPEDTFEVTVDVR